jgi:hypothetical protein
MGTIATQVAIGPWQLLVDLYVTGRLLVTTLGWVRKRVKCRVNDLRLGVRIGDGILTATYDADRKGGANTSASPNLALPADPEATHLPASTKDKRNGKGKRTGKK